MTVPRWNSAAVVAVGQLGLLRLRGGCTRTRWPRSCTPCSRRSAVPPPAADKTGCSPPLPRWERRGAAIRWPLSLTFARNWGVCLVALRQQNTTSLPPTPPSPPFDGFATCQEKKHGGWGDKQCCLNFVAATDADCAAAAAAAAKYGGVHQLEEDDWLSSAGKVTRFGLNMISTSAKVLVGAADAQVGPRQSTPQTGLRRRCSVLPPRAILQIAVSAAVLLSSGGGRRRRGSVPSMRGDFALHVVGVQPSWCKAYTAGVASIRSAAAHCPHNIDHMRLLTDHAIPEFMLAGRSVPLMNALP